MQLPNNINTWQQLNDEDFIHTARHLRHYKLTQLDLDYVETRLKDLGYTFKFGCCGRNELKTIPRV